MTYRTRKTRTGLKTRFRKDRAKVHGAIVHVVGGDTPLLSLKDAAQRVVDAHPDIAQHLAGSVVQKAADIVYILEAEGKGQLSYAGRPAVVRQTDGEPPTGDDC